MNLLINPLKSLGKVMTRFYGSITISIGDIILSVSIRLVTIMVKFFIVEDPFTYNAILG